MPREIRDGSLALGATVWQTTWRQTLPSAVPGIATGTILGLSRAIGEAAPLLIIGTATAVRFDPDGLMSQFTALPIQIYSSPRSRRRSSGRPPSAAIIVLLVMILASTRSPSSSATSSSEPGEETMASPPCHRDHQRRGRRCRED